MEKPWGPLKWNAQTPKPSLFFGEIPFPQPGGKILEPCFPGWGRTPPPKVNSPWTRGPKPKTQPEPRVGNPPGKGPPLPWPSQTPQIPKIPKRVLKIPKIPRGIKPFFPGPSFLGTKPNSPGNLPKVHKTAPRPPPQPPGQTNQFPAGAPRVKTQAP